MATNSSKLIWPSPSESMRRTIPSISFSSTSGATVDIMKKSSSLLIWPSLSRSNNMKASCSNNSLSNSSDSCSEVGAMMWQNSLKETVPSSSQSMVMNMSSISPCSAFTPRLAKQAPNSLGVMLPLPVLSKTRKTSWNSLTSSSLMPVASINSSRSSFDILNICECPFVFAVANVSPMLLPLVISPPLAPPWPSTACFSSSPFASSSPSSFSESLRTP
mmetsp:Transcript_68942/g.174224  ORF Transcript_68942/g.174224 Transcript_68942/m.174224 type:complete len:218 (+) Transcript_68942:1-654(+)